jgi:hypothetical protein
MTLFGDQPFVPAGEAEIRRTAAGLEAVGLSPAFALGAARSFAHQDRRAELADREDRLEREARRSAAEARFLLGVRSGEARTPGQAMAGIVAASADGDELERRREASEARRMRDPMIGQLSGTTMPVPPETPATRAARLRRRTREILGPKRPAQKDTVADYLRYGGGGDQSRHISVR